MIRRAVVLTTIFGASFLVAALVEGKETQSAMTKRSTVYTVPASIPSDCSRAVAVKLMHWIATVPNHSTVRFARNGCYGQDRTITLSDRKGLTIDGNGSSFKALTRGTSHRANWRLQGGSSLTLVDMTVRGSNRNAGPTAVAYNAGLEWQHGFAFDGTQGATLLNVRAYDVYGDFVETEPDMRLGAYASPPVRNLTVSSSHFEGSGRMGLGLTDVDGFVIKNSHVGGVAWDAVDIEPDVEQEYARNIQILDNHFGPTRFAILSNEGTGSSTVGDIIMSGNVENGPVTTCTPPVAVEPPTGTYRSGYTMQNNHLLTASDGLDFSRTDNVTVSGNTVTFTGLSCSSFVGVAVTDSHSMTVSNNTFSGAARATQVDTLSTGLRVSNNST